MAFVVAAVTGSILATLVISLLSAVVTGVFLLANTLLQHKLIAREREIVLRNQATMISKLDEVKQEMGSS